VTAQSSNLQTVEPTVSEERAVRNNPAGAAAIIKRQQAEIERLTLERDDHKADSIRLHKAYCDLKYPGTSPSETSREPVCDHEKLQTVNADGFCLVCGDDVLKLGPACGHPNPNEAGTCSLCAEWRDRSKLEHAELLKKIPRVGNEFVAEVRELSRWALERRVLIQKDWLASYSQCLDGLDLKVGVEAARDPKDIRRIAEALLKDLAAWRKRRTPTVETTALHPAVQALEDLNIPNLLLIAKEYEDRGEQRIPCFLQLEWVERAALATGHKVKASPDSNP
jgi:hypothetical protein